MKFFEESNARGQDAAAFVYALLNEYKVVDEPQTQTISPSGLACQVACAWKLAGAPTTPNKESFQSRSFAENGEDRHARIQKFLSETPYWVDPESYVKDHNIKLTVVEKTGFEVLFYSEEYKVRFRCDGVLLIDGKYYILEIKTERQSANSVRKGPEQKHQKQGLTYSLLLNIDRILWLYEGRDFLEQRPFVQLVTKDQQDEMSVYLKQIQDFMSTPEKLLKDEKNCSACSFRKHCKQYFKNLKKEEAK